MQKSKAFVLGVCSRLQCKFLELQAQVLESKERKKWSVFPEAKTY